MEKSRVEKIRNIIYPFVGCLIGIISSGFICLILLAPLGIMLVFMAEAAIVMLLIIGGIGGIVGFIIGRNIAKRKNKKDNSFKLTFLDHFIVAMATFLVLGISISFFVISFNSINEPDFYSQLSKKEYNAKLLFQADKSFIGKWYCLDYSAPDGFQYYEFKEDGTYTFVYSYGDITSKGVYTIDNSEFPMVMEYTRTSVSWTPNDTPLKGKSHFVFLSENEFSDLGKEFYTFEVGPIFSRVRPSQKNFLDFKMPKRTSYLPTASSMISDKELKGFWENSIKNSLDENSSKKLNYWKHIRNKRYLIYPTSNKELSEGLQDMNYKHIEQVQLDDGEVLLMVYFLGKRYFQYVKEQMINNGGLFNAETGDINSRVKERSMHYGLLFKKRSDGWKLINSLLSSENDGGRDITLETIKKNKNILINQGVFNIEIRSFANQNLSAFMNFQTDKIVAQTNFPLKGNWGNAFGLSENTSTWKKSDFEANIIKLFNEDNRLILAESYHNGLMDVEDRASIDYFKEYGTDEEAPKNIRLKPLVFKPKILNSEIEVDGIIYNSDFDLKFEKIDGNWKLVEMNIKSWKSTE